MTDDYVHWQSVTTRWNDNDMYGHLNNVVHHAIMDTVVNRWMIENGCLDPHDGDTAGLVMEVHCVQAFVDRESQRSVPIEGKRRTALAGLQVSS